MAPAILAILFYGCLFRRHGAPFGSQSAPKALANVISLVVELVVFASYLPLERLVLRQATGASGQMLVRYIADPCTKNVACNESGIVTQESIEHVTAQLRHRVQQYNCGHTSA